MRSLRPVMAVALGLLVAAVGSLPAGAAQAQPAQPEQRYLVQFASGTTADAVHEVSAHGGDLDAVLPLVDTATAVMSASEAAALRTADGVTRVEPDRIARVADVQAQAPWSLDRIDQRGATLDGSYGWEADGSEVAVYVVDTGIRNDHVELAGRVAPGFTNVNDGRGTWDCHGHGTHVAGIVASRTYGVAKGATVVPVRPLECDGTGWYSDILASLDWIVGHHQAGAPAVVNLSLEGEASEFLDSGVTALVADGISVVVAAGNSGGDACASSPGRTPEALTVGASTRSDKRASFSNYGRCLDLFAPGELVTSSDSLSPTDTWTRSGTSMAAPHVTGAVAQLLDADRSLTPAQVADALTARATPGVIVSPGDGSPNRLLYTGALEVAPPPQPQEAKPVEAPPRTRHVMARRAQGSAFVSWRAARDGEPPLTGSTVRLYADGTWVRSVEVRGSATSTWVHSLRPGVAYTFTVQARNDVGAGRVSAHSDPVIPRG